MTLQTHTQVQKTLSDEATEQPPLVSSLFMRLYRALVPMQVNDQPKLRKNVRVFWLKTSPRTKFFVKSVKTEGLLLGDGQEREHFGRRRVRAADKLAITEGTEEEILASDLARIRLDSFGQIYGWPTDG